MTDKEKFIRFKNRLLGPSFMNDGTHFAEVLGWNHFIFWDHIEEKAPYLPITVPLSNVIRGNVILERIEIESSPKRMADLLQGVYDAFAFYSMTPKGDYDDHWRQFASWLHRHIDDAGLSGMKMGWVKKPEAAYTTDVTHEKYYIPGELEITYDGPNWGEKESKKILEDGFTSHVLEAARNSKSVLIERPKRKKWSEKPLGVIGITVIAGVIVAGIVFWLGWK